MSTVEKWLSGITALAIVATLVTNRNSPAVISSITGGVGGIYKNAMGRG
jgi:hypothetical protein